eukprot:CAMPEP_0185031852 /NCGR_PEP_ID=MMETSP1103-20130426/19527_1 /TAXON_ID=36769 /ORGANISM="Paraphysomonas bandaiensis, Strain Caron Lab Isolate" /LENGTH=1150 /DNA_ID=CAMNT_0027567519 /DNA_START=161 /DNA_END=3610 /DNA_ORIENTATION=-
MAGLRSAQVDSLDRHRSPLATEIYSSARTYLRKNNEHVLHNNSSTANGTPNEYENQEKTNVLSRVEHHNELYEVSSSSYPSGKKSCKDKHKKTGRKRTTSAESADGLGIPQPIPAERSRSHTDCIVPLGRLERHSDSSRDYSSDKDELSSAGYRSNSERALLQQAVQQSAGRLMSLSLGRGQAIPHPQQATSSTSNASINTSGSSLPMTVSSPPLSGDGMEDPFSREGDEASIETYIGQTFPRVKDIDKEVVAASTQVTSVEKRHSRSQPLPSKVADESHSQYSLAHISGDFANHTPPYEYKGRKSVKNKKMLKSASASVVGSTENVKAQDRIRRNSGSGNLVTPPRRSHNISGKEPATAPRERVSNRVHRAGSSNSRSNSPMTLGKVNSRGNSRSSSPLVGVSRAIKCTMQPNSRSNSPQLSSSRAPTAETTISTPTTEQIVRTSVAQDTAQGVTDRMRTPDTAKATSLDAVLRERLQEAKAENRKNTSDGATMYQFSLWKGVKRRDVLVEQSPDRIVEGSSVHMEQSVAPPKKSCRLRGVRAAREVYEEAIDATPSMRPMRVKPLSHISVSDGVTSGVVRKEKTYGAADVSSPPNDFTPWKQSRDYDRGSFETEDSDTDVDDEVLSDEVVADTNSIGGGRALAFRSMVGSCKIHESSVGSTAESIQTERGVGGLPHNTHSMDSVCSNNYLSDDFEEIEDEAAILGIAVDDYSLASDVVEEADECDDSMYSNAGETSSKPTNKLTESDTSTEIQNSASELRLLVASNLEATDQAAFSPVAEYTLDGPVPGPPPIRKGDKLMRLFDDVPGDGKDVTMSISSLPTERSPMRESGKGSSGRMEERRKQLPTTSLSSQKPAVKKGKGKKQKAVNVLNESLHKHRDHKHRDQASSPTLSEVSDMDNYQTEDPSKSESRSSLLHSAKSTGSPLSHLPQHAQEEVYVIQDFEWKKGVDIIGEGTFGQVFKGMNCATGELLAVKQISLVDGTDEEVSSLRREIDLMQNLSHPNIVRYVGTSVSSRHLFIVLEYVPGGCVAGMLSQFGAFSEVLIRRLVSQIIQGVDYLHQKGIVHRDVKGANVLVTDAGVAKLADFGCSKQLAGLCTTSLEESMRTIRGSVPWMAPEVIKQNGHGRSADIWSVGATIIEMATAKHPW